MSEVTRSHPAFRLDEEPWIPVLLLDGGSAEVSLRDLIGRAHEIRQIVGDIPQQELPLLRLALAVLYRAYCDPGCRDEDADDLWLEIWENGSFDIEVVNAYLDRWSKGFDLFDDERPFFQVAGLEYSSGKLSPIGEAIADVPKPDKFLFSMRSGEGIESVAFDEAARWLVFMQAFDTAGIKSPVVGNTHVKSGRVYAPKDAVATGWLGAIGGVFLRGANLFETLMLNWVMHLDGAGNPLFGNPYDMPSWEDGLRDDQADQREPLLTGDFVIGPVRLMTWQSRRLRLVCDESCERVIGLVDCYGDILTLVGMEYAETMTAWRQSKNMQKSLGLPSVPLVPAAHNPDRALWRGLEPLLSKGADGDLRPGVIKWAEFVDELLESESALSGCVTVCAQGMLYEVKYKSAIQSAVDETIDLNVLMLRSDAPAVSQVVECINATDKAIYKLGNFCSAVLTAVGDMGSASSELLRERAYAELDDLFRVRLAEFGQDEDPMTYCTAWKAEVYGRLMRIADEFVQDSSVSWFSAHGDMPVSIALAYLSRDMRKDLAIGEDGFGCGRCAE